MAPAKPISKDQPKKLEKGTPAPPPKQADKTHQPHSLTKVASKQTTKDVGAKAAAKEIQKILDVNRPPKLPFAKTGEEAENATK